jgi:hypothetical protein
VISTDGTYATVYQNYFMVNTVGTGGGSFPFRIYVQATDPGAVPAGSIWINTSV